MSQKSSVPQAISFVSQVLKRDSNVILNDCLGCDRAKCRNLSTPTKPSTRPLFEGSVDRDFKPTSARASAPFRNGNSI